MQKSILITGVSGDLGHAVAHKFQSSGYKVCGTGRSKPELEGIDLNPVDLTDENAVSAYVAELTKQNPDLNAAVLLVGGYTPGNLNSTTGSMLRDMYKLNFETAYFVIHALLPHFEAKGGGHFVLIGSRAAFEAPAAQFNVAYGLSKTMLVALANIINDYGKNKGIKCSIVVPSTIDTPRNRSAMPNADYDKWTTAEAIADTIHYLFTESGKHLREPILKMYNEA